MLKGRKHFSQSVGPVLSVTVSKLGKTDHVFVQPGAKIVFYYCGNVLKQGLLPAVHCISINDFVFQQDIALCSHHTVAYLHSNVPEFIKAGNWLPTSPDLNPVDYSVWRKL